MTVAGSGAGRISRIEVTKTKRKKRKPRATRHTSVVLWSERERWTIGVDSGDGSVTGMAP